MRKALVVLVVLAVAAGSLYVAAGRAAGPSIQIVTPERFVGASTPLDVVVQAPRGRVSSLQIAFEQDGTRTPLLSIDRRGAVADGSAPAEVGADGPDRLHVKQTIDRDTVPGLKSGAARIVVTASRPVAWGVRTVTAQTARDVRVRLERPRIIVLSTHHYINQGGSEMVVYRVTPDDVASGVRVGDNEYPGFPAAGVDVEGVHVADPAVRVAFFALLYDQDVDAPIRLYARDEAGNGATADFDHRTFPKQFKKSRIQLDDAFIERVVPAILAGTNEVSPKGSTIEQYVVINSELRRKNAEKIASFAAKTSPDMLWRGVPFHQFANSAVESAFADRRTYIYQGREVDHQVHLGFDLASVANAHVVAANRGTVVYADELGIYGNCVIIDHGMGLQSLYAHLSTIAVHPGDAVDKDQEIGRSGMTGLAGGDHLHFTMLLNGQMVNPVEWWDPHWIQDRIIRKLQQVSAGSR